MAYNRAFASAKQHGQQLLQTGLMLWMSGSKLQIFGLVMLFACIELVQFGWATKLPMLNIPEGIRTLPAAIAGGLIFLFATERAVRIIKGGVSPDEPVVPISDDRSA